MKTNTLNYFRFFCVFIFAAVLISIGTKNAHAGASIISVTFTATDNTLLENYTSEIGEGWFYNRNGANIANSSIIIKSNHIFPNYIGRSQYWASTTPASADYDVEADMTTQSSTIGYVGVAGRISTTTADTSILGIYDSGNNAWTIYQRQSGSATGFAGGGTQALTAGQTYHLKLTLRGTVATLYVDGVQKVQLTGLAVTATGKAGLWYSVTTIDSATISYVDNFAVTNYVSGSSLSVSPTSVVNNTNSASFTLTGVNTNWTSGTPGLPVFQASSTGSGFSVVSQTISSPTSATIVINSGAPGTITIGDYTTGNTTTITTGDPNALSAANSTVVASMSSVKADGIASSTITVAVKDGLGNVLSGKTTTLTSSRGSLDTISPSSVVTDTNGIATFTIKSNTVGIATTTVVSDGTTLSTTPTITFADQYAITTETGITYTSTLDSLALKIDVAYNPDVHNAPVVLNLHGFSGPYTGDDIIQRLAQKGVFAVKIYRRGWGGSAGTQDDGGREIYDNYDAAEYIKSHYAQYIDPDNINVVGYSDGGGNTYGLVTKFPDYFRSANVYFGMSDYGHDPTNSWYYNGANSTYQNGMQSHIGGTPVQLPNNYYARAHYLGAKNNPNTHIQLFYDTAETVCPIVNATQYTSVATTAGFTNVSTTISDSNASTTEIQDNFTASPTDYFNIGSSTVKYIWNSGGYIDWTTDRNVTFSSFYKKFASLRNYDKAYHVKASFNLKINTISSNGMALFGFRNSANTNVKNAVTIVVLNSTPYIRVDYNGTSLDSANRDITAFTTTLSTGTTYGFDLELNNSVATAVLKDANGSTIETQTITFNGSKGFDGVDSFGIMNYATYDFSDSMSGTLDNLSVSGWGRWIHGYPQENSGTAEGNINAENYFMPGIVAGTWTQPVLANLGTMFIPGYIKTKKFQVMVGNGNDHAGNLTYDISGSASTTATAKTFTVEPLTTGTPSVALNLYNLTANTIYRIKDNDLTHGSSTVYKVTTASDGTLTFNGILSSTHQFDVSVNPMTVVTASSTSVSTTGMTMNGSITDTGIENATQSGFAYGTNSSLTTVIATSTLGSQSGAVSFAQSLSGLNSNTTYYFRAYATNQSGTFLGSIFSTTTLVGPDAISPNISSGLPSGSLSAGTTATTLSVTTDENATCRYDTTAGTVYSSMVNDFSTTGGTSHSTSISGLGNGGNYTYYVRCLDNSGNPNSSDYTLSFNVANSSSGGGGGGGSVYYPSQYTNSLTTSPLNLLATSTCQTYGYPQLLKNLDAGNSSSEVIILQKVLVAQNYLSKISGNFDQLTVKAVKDFQKARGIVSSGNSYTTGFGRLGPTTRKLINNLISAGTYKDLLQCVIPGSIGSSLGMDSSYTKLIGSTTLILKNSATTTMVLAATKINQSNSYNFTKPLKLGSVGTSVKALQVFLNNHGFTVAESGSGSSGMETNYFGPATEKALKSFQLTYKTKILEPIGLTEATGYFGKATMEVINGMK